MNRYICEIRPVNTKIDFLNMTFGEDRSVDYYIITNYDADANIYLLNG